MQVVRCTCAPIASAAASCRPVADAPDATTGTCRIERRTGHRVSTVSAARARMGHTSRGERHGVRQGSTGAACTDVELLAGLGEDDPRPNLVSRLPAGDGCLIPARQPQARRGRAGGRSTRVANWFVAVPNPQQPAAHLALSKARGAPTRARTRWLQATRKRSHAPDHFDEVYTDGLRLERVPDRGGLVQDLDASLAPHGQVFGLARRKRRMSGPTCG